MHYGQVRFHQLGCAGLGRLDQYLAPLGGQRSPPPLRTEGGQRRYDLSALRPEARSGAQAVRKTVANARVPSHDQKADLERRKRVLELYCASHGWAFDMIADLGSGMNYRKKGLKRLLDGLLED